MKSDESINTVLIAGGTENVSLVDYTDSSCSFMYAAGAGGMCTFNFVWAESVIKWD